MTITNGYITLADAKNYLRATSVDVTDDAVLEKLIESASRYVDGVTWRRFYTTTADETRYYQGRSAFRVFIDDCLSITSVKLDLNLDRAYDITLAAADYDKMPDNAVAMDEPYTWLQITPTSSYRFASQPRYIQVVGKFGYCSTSTVAESRTFTALSWAYVNVGDLRSIVAGGVKTDSDNNGTFDVTWNDTDDYELNIVGTSATVSVKTGGAYTFPLTASGVQITGIWGITAAPMDIQQAVSEIVVSAYKRRFGENTTGVSSVTAAGVVLTPKDIPSGAASVIQGYSRGPN